MNGLSRFARRLRGAFPRYRRLVLLAVIASVVSSLVMSLTSDDVWASDAKLLVQPSNDATDAAAPGSTTSERSAADQVEVLESATVRAEVQARLSLPEPPPSVRGHVIEGSNVIRAVVRSTDPTTSRLLLQTYIDVVTATTEQAQNTTFISVLDPPTQPDSAQSPHTLRSAILAALAGLALGLLAWVLLVAFDPSVRDRHDVSRLTPRPIVGVLPTESAVARGVLALTAPAHPAVEPYRVLRTNLQLIARDRGMKVLQVVGATSRVGSTTIAANLSVVLAQSGLRVAIVDADFRRPRLREVFAAEGSTGLTDALLGEPLPAVAQTINQSLRLIASGPVPPNPSEMLSSPRLLGLLDELRDVFDFVIVDSAPIGPFADAISVSRIVDGVVVVAQAGSTSRDDLAEAINRLDIVSAPLLAVVLNRSDRRESPR